MLDCNTMRHFLPWGKVTGDFKNCCGEKATGAIATEAVKQSLKP